MGFDNDQALDLKIAVRKVELAAQTDFLGFGL